MQKEEVLKEILENVTELVEEEKVIQNICNLPDIGENFIISLLRSKQTKIISLIPFIYKSCYVLSKLDDAGFKTDPRIKDTIGKSAFFYALKTGKPDLVFPLYDHAANTCLQPGASTQSSKSVILENLKNIKDFFNVLAKEFVETDEIPKLLLIDLCLFNEFLIKICQKLNEIELRVNHHEKYKATSEAKYIILTILETYESFFNFKDKNAELSINTEETSNLMKFYEHKNYFDKLDFSSAILFFEKLFRLKESLVLEKNAYLNVESQFFFYIFFRKFMEQYERDERLYLKTRKIIFQERLLLESQLRRFKEILEKTVVSKNNITKELPKECVSSLTNKPELYGRFLIFRLTEYIKLATILSIKNKNIRPLTKDEKSIEPLVKEGKSTEQLVKDEKSTESSVKHDKSTESLVIHEKSTESSIKVEKSILIIERCVQVMGECCKESNFNSVQKIISSALPEEIIKYLKEIRNRLSHLRSREVLYRNILEQDKNLFIGIQNELKTIRKIMGPICLFHEHDFENIFNSHSKAAIKKLQRKDTLEIHEKNSKDNLQKEFSDQTNKKKLLEKKSSSHFKYIVVNILASVEKNLKENLKNLETCDKSKKFSDKDEIETLDSYFWCLEVILIFMTDYQDLTEYHERLKFILESRKSLFIEMRKNGSQSRVEKINLFSSKQVFPSNPANFETDGPMEARTKRKKFLEDASTFLDDYKEIANNMFQKFPDDSNKVYSFINFEKFWLSLKGQNVLNEEEKEFILQSVPEEYRNFSDQKQKVKDMIQKVTKYYKELDAEIRKMNIKNQDKIEIKENIMRKLDYDYYLNVLNEEEKAFLSQGVPKEHRNLSEQKHKVKDLFEKINVSNEELVAELNKMDINNQDKKEIKENNIRMLDSESCKIIDDFLNMIHDDFLKLKKMLNLQKITEGLYNKLCDKLKIPENAKNKLSLIKSGHKLNCPWVKLEFLQNRIINLRKILIDDNKAIKELWETPLTTRRKMLVKEKMVHLYLNDFGIQASVETLLFDSMSVLSSKELENLWKKSTNLFTGINLRNVLAHGEPILENLGRLLDPKDLPSELVEKIIRLILDEHIIDCIIQILKQSKTKYQGFKEIMDGKRNGKYKNLRDKILECDHWEEYSIIIPGYKVWKRNQEKNETEKVCLYDSTKVSDGSVPGGPFVAASDACTPEDPKPAGQLGIPSDSCSPEDPKSSDQLLTPSDACNAKGPKSGGQLVISFDSCSPEDPKLGDQFVTPFDACIPEDPKPGGQLATPPDACIPEDPKPRGQLVTQSDACIPEDPKPGSELVTPPDACIPEDPKPSGQLVTQSDACIPEDPKPGGQLVTPPDACSPNDPNLVDQMPTPNVSASV